MELGILIYEDNAFMRDSISQMIRNAEGFECKGAYENCARVEQQVTDAIPDVVLMDIEMPDVDGLEGLRVIRRINPTVHVIMLTVFDDNDRIISAIQSGASGYLLKNTPPDKILESIVDVVNGGAPMTPSIARKVLQLFPRSTTNTQELNKLTSREKQVLQLLERGNSYKMISAEIGISIETVRTFIKRIYEKLQVHSATEAVAKMNLK